MHHASDGQWVGRAKPDAETHGAAPLNLLGEHPRFLNAIRMLQRAAPSGAEVLVHGETGTGKELAARAIHYWSDRRSGPFIPINCGAIPDALTESELFGHARGAFTDAREPRQGLIAQARGGTLFLDELEALSLRGQIALLRFLQNQEYRPLGGALVRNADVRIVGATNVDLGHLSSTGQYRADLLFRLNVLTVEMPPLRARGDDVILLARAFVHRLNRRHPEGRKSLHSDAIASLRDYSWPGNVRELENCIHREFLLAEGPELRLASLGSAICSAVAMPKAEPGTLTDRSFREAKARAVAEFERAYIAELLTRAKGNVSLAARLAGKERSRLGKLLRKHGLSGAKFRADGVDTSLI